MISLFTWRVFFLFVVIIVIPRSHSFNLWHPFFPLHYSLIFFYYFHSTRILSRLLRYFFFGILFSMYVFSVLSFTLPPPFFFSLLLPLFLLVFLSSLSFLSTFPSNSPFPSSSFHLTLLLNPFFCSALSTSFSFSPSFLHVLLVAFSLFSFLFLQLFLPFSFLPLPKHFYFPPLPLSCLPPPLLLPLYFLLLLSLFFLFTSSSYSNPLECRWKIVFKSYLADLSCFLLLISSPVCLDNSTIS